MDDSLTKASARPGTLIKQIETGMITTMDLHQLRRNMLQHKAYGQTGTTGVLPQTHGNDHGFSSYGITVCQSETRYYPKEGDTCLAGIKRLPHVQYVLMLGGGP